MVAHQEVTIQQYRGDILPPQLLADYNAVSPGFAERVLTRFEQQTEHRQVMERTALQSDIAERERCASERRRGQYLAFGIGLSALLIGAYTATSGAEWFGTLIGGGGVVSLVWAFLYSHKRVDPPPPSDSTP